MSTPAERRNTLRKATAAFADAIRYRKMRLYQPTSYERPANVLSRQSAWRGHEFIVADIIRRFELRTDTCLEFGVEFGFSAVVFANYFRNVIGIDTFTGDAHAGRHDSHYESTAASLAPYPQIQLVRSDYKDWIRTDANRYALIHVDIIHTYDDTYRCGLWSARHSDCTIFHDTESFPDVKRAVSDIAKQTGKEFHNFPLYHGLGIVV